jgi:hypothetical protein
VFMGGEVIDATYNAIVTVAIDPKSIYPLPSIVDSTVQWLKTNTSQFTEYSRTKTIIGGEDAVILCCHYNQADSGLLRYTMSFVAGDKFIWTVVCAVESNNSASYLDTFDAIVRSLRIEN